MDHPNRVRLPRRAACAQRRGGGAALSGDCLHLLRNDSGDPWPELDVPLGLWARGAGTAMGWVRRRGARGEYTRGGIRQADAADAWRVGRAARTANALMTAIC